MSLEIPSVRTRMSRGSARRLSQAVAPSRQRLASDIAGRRRDESYVADLEQLGTGAVANGPGAMDPSPVESFKAMQQHRAIVLVQDVASDLDDAVRAHTDEVLVVGGMVKLAQRKPVRNGGLATFAVGDDMGSVEQLTVPEIAIL